MYIYVNAVDYGRLLTVPAEPYELVRSIKAKINASLGGNVPEDLIDTLNFNGTTLDCSTPLIAYGITNGSNLVIARSLIPRPTYPQVQQLQPIPQATTTTVYQTHQFVQPTSFGLPSYPQYQFYPQNSYLRLF